MYHDLLQVRGVEEADGSTDEFMFGGLRYGR